VRNDVVLVLVVITALAFDFTNGFHDTGNAMATSIATGALPPRVAVALSGLLNLVGAFLSLAVAATIASGLVNTAEVTLQVVAAGLAGLGDLLATCMSPLSRNRTLGEQLGAGKTLDEILGATRTVAEGVGTAFTVHELAVRHNMQMPVCQEVYRVLNGEIPASEAYRGLRIQAGHEREPG